MNIEFLPIDHITWHPLVADLPIMEEEVERARERIAEHGFIEPLKACLDPEGGYFLLDGRHRHRAAQAEGLTEIPVTLHPEEEAADIALQCLLGRNHFTSDQIAYYAVPHIESKLTRGGDRKSSGRFPHLIKTRDELCAEFHISYDKFKQARELHRIFSADPAYAAEQIPKIFRKENPSTLGAIIAGYGSRLATKGKEQDKLRRITDRTCNAAGTWKNTFVLWEQVPPAEKAIIRTEWARLLGMLPEELRNVRPIKPTNEELED